MFAIPIIIPGSSLDIYIYIYIELDLNFASSTTVLLNTSMTIFTLKKVYDGKTPLAADRLHPPCAAIYIYIYSLCIQSMYVCIYVCMVTHIVRVRINQIRLPILLVVS